MNKLISSVLCFICVFTHCPLQINGLAGPVCRIETRDGMTMSQVKEAISLQTGTLSQDMKLLLGTEELADDSVVDPDVFSLSMIVSKWFVSVTDEQITFRNPNFSSCLLLNNQCFAGRFTPGKYDIDQLFCEAEELWREYAAQKNIHTPFPGLRFCFKLDTFQYSFLISQDVLNRIAQTGILSIFAQHMYDPSLKLGQIRYAQYLRVQLFSLVIRSWGGVPDTITQSPFAPRDILMEDLVKFKDPQNNCAEAAVRRELVDLVYSLISDDVTA